MDIFTTEQYIQKSREAVSDEDLQQALASVQSRLGPATRKMYGQQPEGPDVRQQAHEIRLRAIENLDILLAELADRVTENGGRVFFARDGAEAVAYCLDVAKQNGVRSVVKGKSMVTEEVGLNEALEAQGITVSETDLGEYIIQLAGEKPSHIIAPAIHKNRRQVGRLFAEKLGVAYTEDPAELTQLARAALRKSFLQADMGITGCNLACAQTGHITTVSNEGNIRMSSTLPKVYVAFMGMERVVATLKDHNLLFRLLSTGAAAQKLGGYVSYVGGPGPAGYPDGPTEFHLIIIDNGRSRILADPAFREMLCCIRCSACLNVCPVYGKIGGHAYGSPYSGPVGAVVTPLLAGINRAGDLCRGETLCGACKQACSVDIDLPRMLLELRWRLAEGDESWGVTPVSRPEKVVMDAFGWLTNHPALYRTLLSAVSRAQNLSGASRNVFQHLPGPISGWTESRDLRKFSKKPFREQWKQMQGPHDRQPRKNGGNP
ncbi:MAG: iron-sulfur cluster-binding protein [Desulfobacterales bacterium]|nr:MAG: iron-sulfur cluster-binding protein [Desulfobacterales bacterium]PIE61584.1 MAG: iron-sulfur cluster-binding protein [Desulfobacterales bacterium]